MISDATLEEREQRLNAICDQLGIDLSWDWVAGGKTKVELLTGSTGRVIDSIYIQPVEWDIPGQVERRVQRMSESP